MLAAQPPLYLDVYHPRLANASHDVAMQHMDPTSSSLPVQSYETMPAASVQPPVATGNEPLEQLLPRMTKVLIRGNNRTKSSLVGQHGTVKRSNGLGGWHLVVLESGEEVRLQRNALTVLSVPTASDREVRCVQRVLPGSLHLAAPPCVIGTCYEAEVPPLQLVCKF
jgi:hypothetical protein